MIYEYDLTPGGRERGWVINVHETEASEGIVLKEAVPDYRYGIKEITISAGEDEKYVLLKNGDDNFIGPVKLSKYIPFNIDFESPVYCDNGNALTLVTETDFEIYMSIKGTTCLPIPSQPYNPSPANGAENVSTDTTLTWDSVYESVNYKIYFGTTNDVSLVSEQPEREYDPDLEGGMTYYWRIDEYLNGDSAKGELWTFRTGD